MSAVSVNLRPYRSSDLDFILRLEADENIGPFIRPWPKDQHIAAQSDGKLIYLISETANGPVGFVILRLNPDQPETIEFVRLAIGDRQQGYGRMTIEAVKHYARQELGLNAIWLEVFPENPVAQNLYASLAFKRVDERPTENGFGGRPGYVIRMEHHFVQHS